VLHLNVRRCASGVQGMGLSNVRRFGPFGSEREKMSASFGREILLTHMWSRNPILDENTSSGVGNMLRRPGIRSR
jgi:hypothetical protein